MSSWRLIPADQGVAWNEAIARCGLHDVYHLAQYHRVRTRLADGDPLLFVLEHPAGTAAVPILVRPISTVPSLEAATGMDATSAYGYPGVLSSSPGPDPALSDAFVSGLREAFTELDVVTWFGRQHPLIDSDWLLGEGGETVDIGPTVVIDLKGSEEEIRRRANNNHRRNLAKADRLGITVSEDPDFEGIETFVSLYRQTMQRTGAADTYLFPHDYYTRLKEELGDSVLMFHATIGTVTASSAIVFRHNGIVGYHLGGTHPDHVEDGPARFLLEAVRRWASDTGQRWFHLGGGVGAREDSLFRFKAGFAKTFGRFRVTRWVQDPERYSVLVAARDDVRPSPPDGFFPAYRA